MTVSRGVAAWTVALITAPIYLLTMARAVGFVDRGELAAVAATLGIAHPTGYPTFTLLGHLALRILPLPPILALNTFAALLVAAGAGVMAPLFAGVLDRLTPASKTAPEANTVVAALAALGTALSVTWWRQANGFEVYALHALLLPLVVLLFLRWLDEPTPSRGAWFAATLGLAFTNHMTTILLAPALLATFAMTRGRTRAAWTSLPRLAPWFALGLLPYLWLPLRARMQPRFDWGDPDTWHRFAAHVSGWQFRVWMFSDADTFGRQTAWFFRQLPFDLAIVGLALAAMGLILLFRARARYGAMAALLIAATILYAGNYQIRDIDAYYMTATLAFGLAAAAALHVIGRRYGARIAMAIGGVWVVASGVSHWRACDERPNHLVEDLATHTIGSLPKQSVLLCSQWDYVTSASYFLQEVSGLRRDVLVLDPDLLRRSWYLGELARREPTLAGAARPAIDRFLREVAPFEHQRPFDAAVIQSAYIRMIDTLIVCAAARGRPVFVTAEVSPEIAGGVARVPEQLAFRLATDSVYVAQPVPAWRFRPWPGRVDAYVATTHLIYAQALSVRMEYEARTGHVDAARRYRDAALAYAPAFGRADVPPLPLDGPEIVRQSLDFFDALRRLQGL